MHVIPRADHAGRRREDASCEDTKQVGAKGADSLRSAPVKRECHCNGRARGSRHRAVQASHAASAGHGRKPPKRKRPRVSCVNERQRTKKGHGQPGAKGAPPRSASDKEEHPRGWRKACASESKCHSQRPCARIAPPRKRDAGAMRARCERDARTAILRRGNETGSWRKRAPANARRPQRLPDAKTHRRAARAPKEEHDPRPTRKRAKARVPQQRLCRFMPPRGRARARCEGRAAKRAPAHKSPRRERRAAAQCARSKRGTRSRGRRDARAESTSATTTAVHEEHATSRSRQARSERQRAHESPTAARRERRAAARCVRPKRGTRSRGRREASASESASATTTAVLLPPRGPQSPEEERTSKQARGEQPRTHESHSGCQA